MSDELDQFQYEVLDQLTQQVHRNTKRAFWGGPPPSPIEYKHEFDSQAQTLIVRIVEQCESPYLNDKEN